MSQRNLGRVFVTGADGFIGSHLVERLIDQGHEVTALCYYNSMGSYGWLDESASRSPKNLRLVLGDVRDPFMMEKEIEGHDTVFHLASLIAIPYSYAAPQSYFETNALGTLNVATAALRAKAGRFIHTSTSEVYGSARFVPITEAHPLQGQSPYSASKIGADMAVESFHRSFQLPAVTLRPFNTFGPRQSDRAVIPTIISQLLRSGEVKLGALDPTRDFNYVTNTVDAFLAVATAADDKVLGKTFNAGSGREISIGDLVKVIETKVGVKSSVKKDEQRMRPAQSEVNRLLADSSQLMAATGWKAKVTLEDGLDKAIEWMRADKRTVYFSRYHV